MSATESIWDELQISPLLLPFGPVMHLSRKDVTLTDRCKMRSSGHAAPLSRLPIVLSCSSPAARPEGTAPTELPCRLLGRYEVMLFQRRDSGAKRPQECACSPMNPLCRPRSLASHTQLWSLKRGWGALWKPPNANEKKRTGAESPIPHPGKERTRQSGLGLPPWRLLSPTHNRTLH